jgi:hypothetical protein
MALAIVHRDGHGRAILDAVREVRAPFSPSSVVLEFSTLLKQYRIHEVTGDRYGGEWPREQFRDFGINYQVSESYTSDNYLQFLPILNSGRCELLDHPRMVGQFLCLERRTAPSGRDMITHPRGTHDDIAVAVAGACVLAVGKPSAMEIWARIGRGDDPLPAPESPPLPPAHVWASFPASAIGLTIDRHDGERFVVLGPGRQAIPCWVAESPFFLKYCQKYLEVQPR